MQDDRSYSTSVGSPAPAPSGRKAHAKPNVAMMLFGGIFIFVLGLAVGSGRLEFLSTQFSSSGRSSSAPNKLNYSQLDQLYRTIRDNYDGNISEESILDGIKHGMAESTGDPYTEYMSKKEAAEFSGDLQGTFSGIGAKLELDKEKNVVIAAPLVGSPAEAAGLRAKDVIAAIDGKTTSGLSLNDAVKKIRGERGTKVKLGIIRDRTEAIEVNITRDTIKVSSVESKMLEASIGYIQVSQFSDDTDELAQAAAEKLKTEGAQKIILDLRDNPGGEVESAVNLSSLWLDKNDEVVQQRRGKTVIATDHAAGDNVLKGIPTVVLINAGSASASEITALALRDHGAATIMGEKSYGKGVVQQLFPFDDGSSVKITVARWYSPKGTNIDQKGITPDREVKMTDADYENKADPQLKAATDYLLSR